MKRIIRGTARSIGRLATCIWMSTLLAVAPASAQTGSAQRPINIAVTDLGLPGTFAVRISDRGLVFGVDSVGLNFVLDTRTGAYQGSLRPLPSIPSTSINGGRSLACMTR